MGRFKSGHDWIPGYNFIGRKKNLDEYLTRKYCYECGAPKTIKEKDFVRFNDKFDSTTGRGNEPKGWKIFLYSCDSCKMAKRYHVNKQGKRESYERPMRVNHYATYDGDKYYEVEESKSGWGGNL